MIWNPGLFGMLGAGEAGALIRFRVNASNDGDLAYFDNIRITAL